MKVDPLTLKYLLESMSEGVREIFLVLSGAPESASLRELARVAHKLKGEATVVGFSRLTQTIVRLEDCIQSFQHVQPLKKIHIQILAKQLKPVVSECERIRKTALAALAGANRSSEKTNPARDIASTLNILTENVGKSCGKSVSLKLGCFQVQGLPVKLQKKLQDIAVQLVRNSIAHGIESATERYARGKNKQGLITVSIKEKAGVVTLDVSDDGKGIELEEIRRRLVVGYSRPVKEIAAMSDQTLLDALFLPGFSTLQNVQADAGRGVGLDLVRNAVVRLGGDVAIQYQKNVYCQFTVKIPIQGRALNNGVPLLVNAVMPSNPLLKRYF